MEPERPSKLIATISVALVGAVVLLQVPFSVLAASSQDFYAAPALIAMALVAIWAGGVAIFHACILLLPEVLRERLGLLVLGVAVYAWTRAGIFPGPSFELDGRNIAAGIDSGWFGVGVPVAAGVAAVVISKPRRAIMFLFASLLVSGTLIGASVDLYRTIHNAPERAEAAVATARKAE